MDARDDQMEIGLYTFAEVDPQPGESWAESAARRLRELMEEVELAERVGLDVFGVGEHHRPDYAVSAPAVALAAAPEPSERPPPPNAVTGPSSGDPRRGFPGFATP